jgi:hypothetical protein
MVPVVLKSWSSWDGYAHERGIIDDRVTCAPERYCALDRTQRDNIARHHSVSHPHRK